jgi:hypothetical protein
MLERVEEVCCIINIKVPLEICMIIVICCFLRVLCFSGCLCCNVRSSCEANGSEK